MVQIIWFKSYGPYHMGYMICHISKNRWVIQKNGSKNLDKFHFKWSNIAIDSSLS